MNWDTYEPYVMSPQGAYNELTRRQAKDRYDSIMRARADRVRQLDKLIRSNGLSMDFDDDSSIQTIDEWFKANVEPGIDNSRNLSDRWSAVAFDIALFLGDVMIYRRPNLHWALSTVGGKKAEGYQKHVITGFTKVAQADYYVNVDRRVLTNAYRALASDNDIPNIFVQLLTTELDRA